MNIKCILNNIKLQVINEIDILLGDANVPTIMTLQETLNLILYEKCSLARFGDGELKWMLNIPQKSFQKQDEDLKKGLRRVLLMRNPKFLLALPPCFGRLSDYTNSARNYWAWIMCNHRKEFISLLDSRYIYANLNVTRFYMDYRDKSHVKGLLATWRNIFSGRDIVIIEGEYSRLGVGNDLMSGIRSLRRILCPATDAFTYCNEILSTFKSLNFSEDVLVLLALGPTATVLAGEIFQDGYQVLDVGHIDVEYMWSLLGAKDKVPLPGRYVNEAGGFITELPEADLLEYRRSIIACVGCEHEP